MSTPRKNDLRWPTTVCLAVLWAQVGCGVQKPPEVVEAEARLPETIDFNWHVRPILSDKCFACHGPDQGQREAGLRLDLEDVAKGELPESPDKRAIVPGKLSKSELWSRIISSDPDQRMPQADSNLTLTPEEIAVLARWIEQGAGYKPHWAFIPPERPALPDVGHQKWVRNEIDHFALARLEREGLKPSPEADKERLLRRVTMDLTGLPPTIEEIDAFLADRSANAYEKVVDRLLASTHYGESMAMPWLDLARYADSHGYSQDGYRQMWPWRDWVIQAFNENMPFDEFVTWQVAGDLLPDATQEQRLATAFYRNARLNSEGGIVPEEYRVEYAAERTDLTGTAFLGLTLQCARCHDHKYDAISQKEYYRMFAFFNSVNEDGLVQKDGNSGPQVLLADDEVTADLARLEEDITRYEQQLEAREAEVTGGMRDDIELAPLDLSQGLLAHYPLDEMPDDHIINAQASQPRGKAVGEPEIVPGKMSQAFKFTAYDKADLGEIAAFDRADRFSIGFWVNPSEPGYELTLLSNLAGKNEGYYGYDIHVKEGRPSVRLVRKLPADLVQVTARQALPDERWTHLAVTYDGSSRAKGLKLYLNGKPAAVTVDFDQLSRSIRIAPKELRIGGYPQYAFEISEGFSLMDELRIYERRLSELEVAVLAGELSVSEARSDGGGARQHALLDHYLEHQDPKYRALRDKLETYRRAKFSRMDALEGVMVMDDLPEPRATHVLERGVYDAPGEKVGPGVPAAVLAFDKSLPGNRLGLARWLVSQDNPLTARVTVNRFWQHYFGRGIVGTPGDFGNQGELPTHPELLDWLAREFIDSGWNVKDMQKLIVMSATYRQSSRATLKERQKDPDNQLLARGPSHRLPAELIRDNALASSGLLVERIGGPSVKPYQPEGLWEEKNTFSDVLTTYEQDHGDKLYRRSMYTFWRRTSPHPSMATFDAPTRDFCTVLRQSTSTPLQAFVLMNDPQFVEAARVLAERMIKEGGDTPENRITFAYRQLTGYRPKDQVLKHLTAIFASELDAYSREPERARALLQVGEYPRDSSLDAVEHASYAIVANAIMSLDQTVTKR
ncbi:MAG: DUF1553 domain-containing protein [Luteitalea sp.]|nr:DUF1553 domain-containing protein [Luteitalea sp.]